MCVCVPIAPNVLRRSGRPSLCLRAVFFFLDSFFLLFEQKSLVGPHKACLVAVSRVIRLGPLHTHIKKRESECTCKVNPLSHKYHFISTCLRDPLGRTDLLSVFPLLDS